MKDAANKARDTAFYEHLNEMIRKTEMSKNSLIRQTNIDRSTFFQILAGKRLPTDQQFGAILKTVAHPRLARVTAEIGFEDTVSSEYIVPLSELTSILREYLSLRMDADTFSKWKMVLSFIDLVNKEYPTNPAEDNNAPIIPVEADIQDISVNSGTKSASNSIGATRQIVYSFLREELALPAPSLAIYLSPFLMKAFRIRAKLIENRQPHQKIQQIVSTGCTPPHENIRLLFEDLAELMQMLRNNYRQLYVYLAEDSEKGKVSQLFPYYLLGSNAALLISSDGESCVMIRDETIVASFRQKFEKVSANLGLLFSSVGDYAQLSQMLFERHSSLVQSGSMIVATDRPCALLLVDDEMINTHVPDKNFAAFARTYIHTMQLIPRYCAMMSEEGLTEFEKDRFVSESGIDLHLNPVELAKMNRRMRDILGKKMLLMPFEHYFIHGWEIAVYSSGDAFLSLHDSTDCVIHIQNKEIASVLYSYYDSVRKILQEE